jgi:hypothetical protein
MHVVSEDGFWVILPNVKIFISSQPVRWTMHTVHEIWPSYNPSWTYLETSKSLKESRRQHLASCTGARALFKPAAVEPSAFPWKTGSHQCGSEVVYILVGRMDGYVLCRVLGDVRGELAVAPYVLIDQAAALYSS